MPECYRVRPAFVTENDNEQLGLFGVSYNIACICHEIRWRIQSRKRTHLACYRLLEKRGYDICQGWLVGQNARERHEPGDYGR